MTLPRWLSRTARGSGLLFASISLAQELPELRQHRLPILPPQVAGPGEVLLEATVAPDGSVQGIEVLRATPPYTDLVTREVASWSFEPLAPGDPLEEGSVESRTEPVRVLVAALFRAPAFYAGTTAGDPPASVGTPSAEVPFPEAIISPTYPPTAYGDGIVLIAAEVSPQGAVSGATVLTGGTGFESAALDAARRWRFRPARQGGAPVPSVAFLIFGFRQPVVPG